MHRTVVVAALTLGISVAIPATASQAAAGNNQVTGTAALGQFGNPTAHVNAIQTPAGLKGSFHIEYADTTSVAGKPKCLVVSGDVAYVIATITAASGPRAAGNAWQPGNFLVIGVKDGGEPGTAGDLLNFSPGFASAPACAPNGAATPVFPIVEGNYKVASA
jgi:hypothetical protein